MDDLKMGLALPVLLISTWASGQTLIENKVLTYDGMVGKNQVRVYLDERKYANKFELYGSYQYQKYADNSLISLSRQRQGNALILDEGLEAQLVLQRDNRDNLQGQW